MGNTAEIVGCEVRVNVLSGIVATIVVVLAHQITSGNAAKYFDAVLGVTGARRSRTSCRLTSFLRALPLISLALG